MNDGVETGEERGCRPSSGGVGSWHAKRVGFSPGTSRSICLNYCFHFNNNNQINYQALHC